MCVTWQRDEKNVGNNAETLHQVRRWSRGEEVVCVSDGDLDCVTCTLNSDSLGQYVCV